MGEGVIGDRRHSDGEVMRRGLLGHWGQEA